MIYNPGFINMDSSESLYQSLSDELYRIQQAFDQLSKSLGHEINFNPPTKPQPLQVVFADGVKWNPGKGAGYYLNVPELNPKGEIISSSWKKIKFE